MSTGSPVPAEPSAVEQRLHALGYAVPSVAPPVASYVPALVHGHLTYTSGQLPFVDGQLPAVGKVGSDGGVSPEEAHDCARLCALNAIAAVKSVLGDLDRVTQVVKVVGFVASDPDFTGQPAVVNGASELLGHAFGSAGVHARSAVGVAVLPMNSPVEVEIVVSTAPSGEAGDTAPA
ncbi:MAG TPA: RidA family protein [Ornithinimicrobium sp.]|uniref:RidA family protein n=1 Tax=Ornithinimicrobium sp. TaxID=1977084 RepID=UPI002B4A0E0B|nr:RidA family protein [Ornithinimicrobium sp.]HKJ12360.1 RidA family protein [Ornithinimicrobium sp.]